jgi:alpha-mannosidase
LSEHGSRRRATPPRPIGAGSVSAPLAQFRFLVVPHTHWDREWYVPFEVFRLRLGKVIDGVLDTLERDESFRSFTLDGQAIVLEDYLDVRPDDEGRLRTLLAAGRLEVGPWYVLADELLVGGEALVRNLLHGRRVCRRFGVEPARAGYAPDSFGHPAQLPQILAGFGLATVLFSRGLGDDPDLDVVFRWRAAGTEVTASQFLPHYDNFAQLTSAADAAERIEQIVDRFGESLERVGCDSILLASGSDHLPVQPGLPGWCAELAEQLGVPVQIGRYSDFEPPASELASYEGELVGSRLQNVLRGVNSARMYLKQANERAERRLLGVESVAALRSLRDGSPFPHADVGLAWRDVLRNHPHDSICGCSCDEVHRDMLVRYEQLDRTLDVLAGDALGDGDAIVNCLPYRRSRLVESNGRSMLVELGGFEARLPEPIPVPPDRLEVDVAPDGTLSVTHLGSGRRFTGLHVVEDEPDLGDLYTFCPGGSVRRAKHAGSRVLRDDDVARELLVESELPGVRVQTVVRLVRGSDRVELRTTVENEDDDHRLRVSFPLEPDEQIVRAESQFAIVRRPVQLHEPRTEWVEPPIPTAHTLGAVALGPLAVLTKGLPEYEAGPGGLRLTLLRCVGVLARPPGLATRPSGAGPEVSTPEGQCRGTHVFEYALRFDADELSDAALIRAGQDYRTDFATGEAFDAPVALAGDLVFSCLKGADDGDGVVLRVFNPNPDAERLLVDGAELRRVRLDEEGEAEQGLELAPGEIATFRLSLRP